MRQELAKQITLEQMYPANDDEDSYDEMEANTASEDTCLVDPHSTCFSALKVQQAGGKHGLMVANIVEGNGWS